MTLPRGFYLGKYELTQSQYEVVMGSNPSTSTRSPECPADTVGESEALESRLEYTLTLLRSGEYWLTARVVTVNDGQRLNVAANRVGSGISMEMPFTLGEWQESEPVSLTLKEDENVLQFWRDQPPQYGLAIKEFTLAPVKERDGRLNMTEALQKRSGE